MRFFGILISIACVSTALAGAADDETIADYASKPRGTRSNYASYIADILRQNHPRLTRDAMFECLESVAREPNLGGLKLQSQAIICATIIDH